MPSAQPRYFYRRNPETSFYHIRDRYLGSDTIATCNYIEQAKLLVNALNQQFESNQVNAASKNVKPAAHPDDYDYEQQ